MSTVWLVSWNERERREKEALLVAAGHCVATEPAVGPAFLRAVEELAPAAVVIDLDRVPSHGRDVALALRERKGTRHLPLVFGGGASEKVEKVRSQLPDASFAAWGEVAAALVDAVANPPATPVVPTSRMAGYAGTPLPQKLGIREGFVVGTRGAPASLAATLAPLPDGARLSRAVSARSDLALWFVRSQRDLDGGIEPLLEALPDVPLWILWPKKTGPIASDLGQPEVRAAGLSRGLVDYKICALDDSWSGLLFRRRG